MSLNLKTVEPNIHASMNLYAFIAIVPSSSTLDELIQMVKSDNDKRQRGMDCCGVMAYRSLNVNVPFHACLPIWVTDFHGQV